jgi:hypothetical protein
LHSRIDDEAPTKSSRPADHCARCTCMSSSSASCLRACCASNQSALAPLPICPAEPTPGATRRVSDPSSTPRGRDAPPPSMKRMSASGLLARQFPSVAGVLCAPSHLRNTGNPGSSCKSLPASSSPAHNERTTARTHNPQSVDRGGARYAGPARPGTAASGLSISRSANSCRRATVIPIILTRPAYSTRLDSTRIELLASAC